MGEISRILIGIVLLGALAGCGSERLLITNVKVYDGHAGNPRNGMDLFIENGHIKKYAEKVRVKRRTQVIEGKGKTVIPGLFDMHAHFYANGAVQTKAYPQLFLAGGVTSVFSVGELDPEAVYALKDSIANDQRVGPEIFMCGGFMDSSPSALSWNEVLTDSVSIVDYLTKWKGRIHGLKIYTNISKDHFAMLALKAKELGLVVTGHLGSLEASYAIDHGITGIEHGLFSIKDFGGDPRLYRKHLNHLRDLSMDDERVSLLIEKIRRNNIYIDPTIVTLEFLFRDKKPLVDTLVYYLDAKAREYTWSSPYDSTLVASAIEKQLQFIKKLSDAGCSLVTGSDPSVPEIFPGVGVKREIELFVRAGIPLANAIHSATLVPATILGVQNKTGSITVGKSADLVVLDGDLENDIESLFRTTYVVKKGKLYIPHTLLESAKGKITSGRFEKSRKR
jgi:predicted amidohydrolase